MSRQRRFVFLAALSSLWFMGHPIARGADPTFPAAPEFTLVDITGRARTLAEQRGKVVVLSFWATWCGPCQVELPRLHDVYKRHKREPVEMYAISVDGGATVALVPVLAQQMRLSFPVLLDTDNRVVMKYNKQGVIPWTVIVDQQGRIRHIHAGYVPGEEARVEAEIVELLKQGGGTKGTKRLTTAGR